MTENPGAGERGCCKVLSIELVFDHSRPCLECRPSAVILESMWWVLELEAVVVAIAWCVYSLFHALVLSCICSLVNKSSFTGKCIIILYMKSPRHTEFKTSLCYIATKKRDVEVGGAWGEHPRQQLRAAPHTSLFYLCIVLGGKIKEKDHL